MGDGDDDDDVVVVLPNQRLLAYATIPKGMMGYDCSLLHRQVHEFSARWKAALNTFLRVLTSETKWILSFQLVY